MRKNIILAKKIIRAQNGLLFFIVLFVILAAVTVPRTSLTDWDEGVFALQSRWFSSAGQEGKPYNFQTPPLFQLTAAAVSWFSGSNAYAVKWLSVFFSCITMIAVFKLAKHLYSENVGMYSVFIFMTTEYFLFFSRSGLSDATFVCFSTLAVLFFVRAINSTRLQDCLFSSVFIILALYTKYSGIALPAILFFLGFLYRKRLHRFWFLLTIVVPSLFFLPFSVVYLWVVGVSELQVRHGSLLGVHHLKYLYYLFIFAPVILFLTILQVIRARKKFLTSPLFIIMILFFILVGFYHPFFRLLYPLIPLGAITAARSLDIFHRYKSLVLAVIAFSLLLSFRTITYTTKVPEQVAARVKQYAQENEVHYVYSTAPPNVLYYLGGDILIPADHPWTAIGRKVPFLINERTIIYRDSILFEPEEQVVLVHATAVDSLKRVHESLFSDAVKQASFEFIDAPVYYKDLFNIQRDISQNYEVYLFRAEKGGDRTQELWEFGFLRSTDVLALY